VRARRCGRSRSPSFVPWLLQEHEWRGRARGSFDVVPRVGRMGRRVTRTIRAVRIAATDARIPGPLRWLAAVGLAPIPGPVDEVILVIVAVPLALFYRGPLREAWASAGIDMPPSTP
jgi:hypothetical protein